MKKMTILALLASILPISIACMDDKGVTLEIGGRKIRTTEAEIRSLKAGHEESNRKRAQNAVDQKLQLKAPVAPSRLTEIFAESDDTK
jgi:hypothetical protein